jgi:fumarylacetoacetase
VGIFIGNGNPLGDNIAMEEAEDHVFGLCLLNDWSARDIQAWEYQPLGPFLAKNFASTISPWLVTMEALAPFRTAFNRPPEDPQPLPYLSSSVNSQSGAIDMALEVYLLTDKMASDKLPPQRLSQSNFADSYWTIAQMVTHHTISGCNLRPGDLFGSGTMSGPTPEQAGSLLELSNGGKQAITLINGEQRSFLEDGDTVILKAHCDREGARRIGFGEVKATILPTRNI